MSAKFDNQDGRLRGSGLQRRRLKKWTEAIGQCAHCHKLTNYADPRVDPQGFHLDHIAMLEKSQDDSEENTQILCVPCHDRKTMQDMGYRERVEFDKEGRVKW